MSGEAKDKWRRQEIVMIVLLVLGVVFITAVLLVISLADLTNRETTLLGTVLTLLSVLIGWGISHFYASQDKKAAIEEVRDFEQRNLRTYALKAAEKVTNLSKELNRLSAYLQEELQFTDYRNAEDELFAKEERIESAIHMLGSLRSINDTSLSDWQGVIGEELDEQREAEQEQAAALQELSDRLTSLEVAPPSNVPSSVSSAEIDEIKRQLRAISTEVSGGGFRSRPRPIHQQIQLVCPNCSALVSYGQRSKENDCKALQCKACETNLISTYREATGFVLTIRGVRGESAVCPTCSTEQVVQLDEWPSASATFNCRVCSGPYTVSRTSKAGVLKTSLPKLQKAPTEPLTAELIELVRAALPPQPWPKGVHQTVATQLSVRPTTVQRAIQHLIRMGVFMDQIEGVVCTAAEKLQLMRETGTKL
ncbi:hypothetical protein [Comamonas sp.]|uniref:hypothetical protein n=1 Tax=Comamonas sp. TaxID=34028 RepID=UPI0028A1F70D|nr:hypothetical protein [Comamonas sp.]